MSGWLLSLSYYLECKYPSLSQSDGLPCLVVNIIVLLAGQGRGSRGAVVWLYSGCTVAVQWLMYKIPPVPAVLS